MHRTVEPLLLTARERDDHERRKRGLGALGPSLPIARLADVQGAPSVRVPGPRGILPWRVVPGFGGIAAILDRDGRPLCSDFAIDCAHQAALAVNAHSRLLASDDRQGGALLDVQTILRRVKRTIAVIDALKIIEDALHEGSAL